MNAVSLNDVSTSLAHFVNGGGHQLFLLFPEGVNVKLSVPVQKRTRSAAEFDNVYLDDDVCPHDAEKAIVEC